MRAYLQSSVEGVVARHETVPRPETTQYVSFTIHEHSSLLVCRLVATLTL